MKTKAILFLIGSILFPALANAQDTIYAGSIPSEEYFRQINEQMKIMEYALQEQFKALEINTDSLEKNLERLRIQFENIPEPVIPEDFMKDFQLYFPQDIHVDFPEEFNFDFFQDFRFNVDMDVFSTTVNLDGTSGKKEVLIIVEETTPSMMIDINGEVSSGIVKVEILDPAGKKQGGFSVENSDAPGGEVANGIINKNVKSPATGKWKVVISSDKAVGKVFVSSIQQP